MESEVIDLPRTKKESKEDLTRVVYEDPIRARRALNLNLFNFLRYFWPVVSNDTFLPNWHIEYLCEELEKVAHRVAKNLPREYDLIINVPPGSTKTITCSIIFPVWCWTQWHWMRFITASYSSPLSLESAEYSRDLIRSDAFCKIYPELSIKDDKDAKGNFKVVKKHQVYPGQMARIEYGGNRFSTSVGATVTGFHGHILIWDDLLNPEQAVSEKEVETANRWLDQTLSMRKTDKKVTATIGIMQRLRQNDPTGHILEKKKTNVKHICLPGEIRNYRNKVSPQELVNKYKDDLLDPVRLSWKVLEDIESQLGQYGYAGQIGQNPTPPGGGMFKVDHFQMIATLPSAVNIVETVRYWDKAGTVDAGAYTVGVKIHKLVNDHYIIEDVVRGRWASEEREDIIRETAVNDGRDTVVGIEQEPGSGGKESAEGTIRNLAGFNCFLDKPGAGSGNKEQRADPFSVQVNHGNVQMLVADWNHEFKEEFRNFPFSTYKDQVDAGSGAFNHLIERRVVRPIGGRRRR